MSHLIPEELLSAYLDNELSDEERTQVEQHLEENADSRRLLAEISEVRDAIKKLPRESLAPDFAATVMRAVTSAAQPDASRAGNSQTWWADDRIRWAAGLAMAAAAILIGILAIDFLPTPNVAKQNLPTDLRNDQGNDSIVAADESNVSAGDATSEPPKGDNKAVRPNDPPGSAEKQLADSNAPSSRSVVRHAESAPAEAKVEPPDVLRAATSADSVTSPPPTRSRKRAELAVAEDRSATYSEELVYDLDTSRYTALSQLVRQWRTSTAQELRQTRSALSPITKLAAVDKIELADDQVSFVATGTREEVANLFARLRVPTTNPRAKSLGLEWVAEPMNQAANNSQQLTPSRRAAESAQKLAGVSVPPPTPRNRSLAANPASVPQASLRQATPAPGPAPTTRFDTTEGAVMLREPLEPGDGGGRGLRENRGATTIANSDSSTLRILVRLKRAPASPPVP